MRDQYERFQQEGIFTTEYAHGGAACQRPAAVGQRASAAAAYTMIDCLLESAIAIGMFPDLSRSLRCRNRKPGLKSDPVQQIDIVSGAVQCVSQPWVSSWLNFMTTPKRRLNTR